MNSEQNLSSETQNSSSAAVPTFPFNELAKKMDGFQEANAKNSLSIEKINELMFFVVVVLLVMVASMILSIQLALLQTKQTQPTVTSDQKPSPNDTTPIDKPISERKKVQYPVLEELYK